MADNAYAGASAPRNPICEQCGAMIPKRPDQNRARWLARRFCSRACSNVLGKWGEVNTEAKRLNAKLLKGAGPKRECWEWQGTRLPSGYGRIGIAGKGQGVTDLTHRVAYRIANGEIPPGMEVCHTCDNPPCCNPDHLFLGTHADNMRDMSAKGRAHRQPNRPGLKRNEI